MKNVRRDNIALYRLQEHINEKKNTFHPLRGHDFRVRCSAMQTKISNLQTCNDLGIEFEELDDVRLRWYQLIAEGHKAT